MRASWAAMAIGVVAALDPATWQKVVDRLDMDCVSEVTTQTPGTYTDRCSKQLAYSMKHVNIDRVLTADFEAPLVDGVMQLTMGSYHENLVKPFALVGFCSGKAGGCAATTEFLAAAAQFTAAKTPESQPLRRAKLAYGQVDLARHILLASELGLGKADAAALAKPVVLLFRLGVEIARYAGALTVEPAVDFLVDAISRYQAERPRFQELQSAGQLAELKAEVGERVPVVLAFYDADVAPDWASATAGGDITAPKDWRLGNSAQALSAAARSPVFAEVVRSGGIKFAATSDPEVTKAFWPDGCQAPQMLVLSAWRSGRVEIPQRELAHPAGIISEVQAVAWPAQLGPWNRHLHTYTSTLPKLFLFYDHQAGHFEAVSAAGAAVGEKHGAKLQVVLCNINDRQDAGETALYRRLAIEEALPTVRVVVYPPSVKSAAMAIADPELVGAEGTKVFRLFEDKLAVLNKRLKNLKAGGEYLDSQVKDYLAGKFQPLTGLSRSEVREL